MNLAIVAALLLIVAEPIAAQNDPALVIFHSVGCVRCGKLLAAGFAGSADIAYRGVLYDEDQRLLDGISVNRFVTLKLAPGQHIFSGQNTYSKKRNEEHDLPIELISGRHYFVRLEAKNGGVYLVRKITPVFALVECSVAFEEGAKAEPIAAKHIGKGRLSQVVATPYFPNCDTASQVTNR